MRTVVAVAAVSLLVGCSGSGGKDGAAGPTGPGGSEGRPGLTWRGPWSSSTSYASGDVVESGGSAYVSTGSSLGAQPPAAPWQVLAASSVAQTVDVGQVVAPVTVAEVTAPVAVSGIAAPVAVSGISSPVVVSQIQSPIAVSGTVRVSADYYGLPVYLTSSSSTVAVRADSALPVSVSGGVACNIGSNISVTPKDLDPTMVVTGDNSGGTVVPCPDFLSGVTTTCRRVATAYGSTFLTDLVVTARDDAPTAARTAMAFAAKYNDPTATPRWKVALRYVQPQGGSYVPITSTLTGARFLLKGGDALYLADSGDATITWSMVGSQY